MRAESTDPNTEGSPGPAATSLTGRPPKTLARRFAHVVQAGLGLIAALCLIAGAIIPAWSMTGGLDPSWQIVLARSATESWQFGTDVVFTYGPLGFLDCLFQLDTSVGTQVAWQLGSRVAVAALALFAVWISPRRWLALLWIFMASLWSVGASEAYHSTIALLVAYVFALRPVRPLLACAIGAMLGVFALIKFSTTLLLAATLVCLVCAQLQRRNRPGAVAVIAGFVGAFVGMWVFRGQHLANLPAFFINAWEVASGYNANMGLETPTASLVNGLLALAFMLLGLGIAAVQFWSTPTPADRSKLWFLCVAAGATFLMWKHGFVRSDLHMLGHFGWLAAAPVLVVALAGTSQWRMPQIAIAASALAAVGIAIHGHNQLTGATLVTSLRNFPQGAWHNFSHTWNVAFGGPTARAQYAPERSSLVDARFRQAIGSKTVDYHGAGQALLVANDLSLKLRPVIQSYSAYTPRLAALNEAFLRRPDGPEAVLLDYGSIDGRFPALDDASALHQLLLGYRAVNMIQGLLLFERNSGPVPASLPKQPDLRMEATFGQTIELPDTKDGTYLWAAIHIDRRLTARLRQALYKLYSPLITLETSDGMSLTYGLPPAMSETPFLLSPLVTDTYSFVRLVNRDDIPRVTRLRLEPSRSGDFYKEKFVLELWRSPAAVKASIDMAAFYRSEFPELKSTPITLGNGTRPEHRDLNGRKILYIHAPGSMTFSCSAGPGIVTGTYGILPTAYTEGTTDGIGLRITVDSLGQQQVVYERWLRPRENESEQGPQDFRAEFVSPAAGTLTIELNPGNHGDTSWDWSYLSDVEISSR